MNTDAITRERLERWRGVLKRQHATPAVLVAIGHEYASGQVHVVTTEDVTHAELAALLAGVLQQLIEQGGT